MFKCPICLQNCKRNTRYTLKCRHAFCQTCILTWFSDKTNLNSCPMCRSVHTRPHTRSTHGLLTVDIDYGIGNGNCNGIYNKKGNIF